MEDETIKNEVCVCGNAECKCGEGCIHEVEVAAAENAKWGKVGYDIPGVFYPIYLSEGILGDIVEVDAN